MKQSYKFGFETQEKHKKECQERIGKENQQVLNTQNTQKTQINYEKHKKTRAYLDTMKMMKSPDALHYTEWLKNNNNQLQLSSAQGCHIS